MIGLPERGSYDQFKRMVMRMDVLSVVYVGGHRGYDVVYNDSLLSFGEEKDAMHAARTQARPRRPLAKPLRLVLTRDQRRGIDGRYDDDCPPPF